MYEVEEALVPGDEDETNENEEQVVVRNPAKVRGIKRKEEKKRRKRRNENPLRLSSSAPDLHEDLELLPEIPSRPRTSSTNSEYDESWEDEGEETLQFDIEDSDASKTKAASGKPKRSLSATTPNSGTYTKNRESRTAIKLQRNLKKTRSKTLHRTNVDISDRKNRKKKSTERDGPFPMLATLFSQFQRILTENESEVLRIFLRHASAKNSTESSQRQLLFAIVDLLLVPDGVITTTPFSFLVEYLNNDITDGTFSADHWKYFAGKDKDVGWPSFTGLIGLMDNIQWWHIAESYLVSLLSKTVFFRDCLRKFLAKLNRTSGTARFRHKMFPLLTSFFNDLISSISMCPRIVFETITNLKTFLESKCGVTLATGALFRITVESIAAILYNPRKYNIECDITAHLKTTLQNISVLLRVSQLKPNYEGGNAIESSLVERISNLIHEFLVMCSSPKQLNSERVMSWPDSRAPLTAVYNHFLQNFEKLWSFIFTVAPSLTQQFAPFFILSLEAIKSTESQNTNKN